MECKFCGATLEEDVKVCPVCGKDLTEEIAEEPETCEEFDPGMKLEPCEDDEVTEETETTEEAPMDEEPAPVKKNNGKYVLLGIIIALVAAVVAFTAFLYSGVSTDNEDITVKGGKSYTMPVSFMTREIGETVIASTEKASILSEAKELFGLPLAKDGMTNADLAIYYWDTFYALYNMYSGYIQAGYMKLDPANMEKDLCPLVEGQTWQEYFLSQALNRYRSQTALCEAGEKAGFKLSEEQQKEYDETIAALSAEENAAEQLEMIYGPGVTMEDYLEYWTQQFYYSCYVMHLEESVEYTTEDLSAYYDAHADQYGVSVQKIDKPMMSVRHILIMPAATKTEEDWAAAKQKAEEVYNTFLAGDKTEASFGELAKLHSGDGNAADGGIYENVYPGQMVKTFNDWCFDESRKAGDTGIVETDFGYHIMYYVAQSDKIYWQEVAAQDLVNEEVTAKLSELGRSYVIFWEPENTAISLPGQIAPAPAPAPAPAE